MSKNPDPHPLPDAWATILEARQHDPFSVLGRHGQAGEERLLVFLPEATRARIEGGPELNKIESTGLFQSPPLEGRLPVHYTVVWTDYHGDEHRYQDPYTFRPQIADYDRHLFGEGRHWHAYRFLGARTWAADNCTGVLFATWAPNATRISVVGDFNQWDGRRHPMRVRGGSGIWELFIPGLSSGELYKFEIRTGNGEVLTKSDPYGREFEVRPSTAARVRPGNQYVWQDLDWLNQRRDWDWQHRPMSVYEVHLGSWRRDAENGFINYRELAQQLVDYVRELGFTHIELLPITEHPLDASWGYQTTGYFAPTSRFGGPDDFRWFVDHCHRHHIGVIMDWVPAHFPKDDWALARFDGTALYEHEDPRLGEHREWGTLIFNYSRLEVKNFLLASAVYWMEEFHIDGLRVDAVASMLYLDYSREPGEWLPNVHGGRENLEAIAFLRELNEVVQGEFPGAVLIAEESTAWPQVTRPPWVGGLGFNLKWNMGWMHDTLDYLAQDPIYRHYHHDQLTFGMMYAFTENFMLPLSHDEVVHMKGSLLHKMPGDDWQRFANLRLLYVYLFTYPGKKLLFMGGEFAQSSEWDESRPLDWWLLEHGPHVGIQALVRTMNHLYQEQPALHAQEFEPQGFSWIDCHDASQSVLSYRRHGAQGEELLVVLNFTPIPRHDYRLGVSSGGHFQELLNSDSSYFGGSNLGNGEGVDTEEISWMGEPHSLRLTLPPLGGIILKRA